MLSERFRMLQVKWRKQLVYINWTMVFVSTMFNIIPIFINGDSQRHGYPSGQFLDLLRNTNFTAPVSSAVVRSILTDDGTDVATNLHLARIEGPFLGMCLAPLIDLLVEAYIAITHPATEEVNANNSLKVVRLSILERFVFILGVICNAAYFLIPSEWNVMITYTVRNTTINMTALLMGAPLIIFLERTTNVFSPFFTTFIIFLFSLGVGMTGFLHNFPNSAQSHVQESQSAQYITIFGIVLVLLSCLWSFYQYLFRRVKTDSDENNEQHLDPFHDFSTTQVPACHMVTLCVGYLIGIFLVLHFPPPANFINYTLLLLATSLVFVVEMRIRQNEVFSGLRLLDLKNYEAKLAETEAAAHASMAGHPLFFHHNESYSKTHLLKNSSPFTTIEQEKAAKEREMHLTLELRENIINSAHDIKSPTTALGLAVESLLFALDSNKPLTEAKRKRAIGTLHSMEHTIAALTMIINRSVDACLSASSDSANLIPNKVPVHLKQVMDEILAFSKWQADGSGIEVVMDPLPDNLSDEIMMDEKWLKDDLYCLAGNVVKYSRSNQKVPAVMRIAIVPAFTAGKSTSDNQHPQSVQFSFIDSGYPLPEERLTNLFNRPVHSERTQVGGMGLGLFCLSEHVKALQGQYGARKRLDGREGTEIWFSFPLIVPKADVDEIVMEDLGYDTHESTTASVAEKSLFSSPQNRRASMTRSLKDSTLAISGLRKSIANGGQEDAIIGGGSTKTDLMQEVVGASPMLIVDDSPMILKMTKGVIRNECANISFTEAKDGKEAFERVAEAATSYGLIITDIQVNIFFRHLFLHTHIFYTPHQHNNIQMPICNGFDFTRKVRQMERDKRLTPRIIIGISANDQPKISMEAKESGMDGFLHKPFKLAALMDVIEEISNHRKQTSQKLVLPTVAWPLAAASVKDDNPKLSGVTNGVTMTDLRSGIDESRSSGEDNKDDNIPVNGEIHIVDSDVIASQIDDNISALEQDGTLPISAVSASETDWVGKLTANKTIITQQQTGNGNGTGTGIPMGLNNSAKVYAALN